MQITLVTYKEFNSYMLSSESIISPSSALSAISFLTITGSDETCSVTSAIFRNVYVAITQLQVRLIINHKYRNIARRRFISNPKMNQCIYTYNKRAAWPTNYMYLFI